jgi:hypothetical protein
VITPESRILAAYISPQLRAMLTRNCPGDLDLFPGLSVNGGAL